MKTVHRIWHTYSPFIHIGVWLVMAGWYGNIVYAQAGRIDKIDQRFETVDIIKQDVSTVKESIRWIEKALGRR